MQRRDQIIELNNQGKSRVEICQILQCSKSVVCYHLSPGQKEKSANRLKKYRAETYIPTIKSIAKQKIPKIKKEPKLKINCNSCGMETCNNKFCSRKCRADSQKVQHRKLPSNCFYCQVPLNGDNAYNRKTVIQNICKACSSKANTIRKYNLKKYCVEYKGGCCVKCGYNRNLAVLQFHHVDAAEKEFNFAKYGKYKFSEELKKELDKCVLLCANCHFETHHPEYGNATISKNTGALTPFKIYQQKD